MFIYSMNNRVRYFPNIHCVRISLTKGTFLEIHLWYVPQFYAAQKENTSTMRSD